jgi:murein L,D-transpeptidase YafK
MKRFSILAIGILLSGAVVWALTRKNADEPLPALENPRLVVKKSKRRLYVYDNDKLVKTYRVALGFAPAGDKETEGDGKTPEGEFYLAVKNDKSKFVRSLGLSYPAAEDATRGLQANLITSEQHSEILQAIDEQKMPPQKTALGGEIYIHGGGTAKDWTEGCVALEDTDILELFEALPHRISVRIEP